MSLPNCEMLIHTLLTDPAGALYPSVASRVWSPIAAAGFANTEAAVIFHVEGMSSYGDVNRLDPDVLFKCYGGSGLPSASAELATTLISQMCQLAGIVTDYGTVLRSDLTTAFSGGIEPDTGWPVYIVKVHFTLQG